MPPSLICSKLPATAWLFCSCVVASTVTGAIEVAPGSEHARVAGSNLADIVVWLQPQDGSGTQLSAPAHIRLLQKDKMFHPHVLPIRVGTIVDFPNADPIFHNAFSNYDGQLFDVGLYPPGTSRSVRFRRPGVVRVFCNIHPAMSAIILALDTPYFNRAAKDGQFRIPDVPPGRYELHVFDERATQTPEAPILIDVEPGDLETSAPLIRLGESGYVRPAHKNKFGLDYPLESTGAYSGPPQ